MGNDVGIGTTNATDPTDTSQSVLKVFGNSYLRSANIGTSISVGSGIVTANKLNVGNIVISTNGFISSGIDTGVRIFIDFQTNEIEFEVQGIGSTFFKLF